MTSSGKDIARRMAGVGRELGRRRVESEQRDARDKRVASRGRSLRALSARLRRKD